MFDRAVRERKKFWGGLEFHPFIERFGSLLSDMGFSPAGFDEAAGFRWRKPAFEGYEFEIGAAPDGLPPPRGHFRIRVPLVVTSARQTEVNNRLNLWECANLNPRNRVRPCAEPTWVIHTPLEWLLAVWEPKLGDFAHTFNRWKCMSTVESARWAEDVFHCVQSHATPYFALIDTPEKLARRLQDLPAFPGRVGPGGPGSIDATVFSAVLWNDLGQPTKALEQLDVDRRWTEARVARGEKDELFLNIRLCEIGRMRDWISGCANIASG
ncbi:MAG TPA: hypothetical protein VFB32_18100 [Rudaea sp.]|nr:hypothetical protein [Rudaea sp.]